ncbi:MAG TPA: cation diffusion facilitator family transporter [Solirubrobacteraceae bacterium]|nr:cation diffusion facilitator family transporter [Solirubrobacteraceae bacterium]
MAHDHAHAHGARGADTRRLAVALGLILLFMAFEVAMAVVASSLALLSDAAHMLTDAAALGLAIFAARLAARPARGAMTYGLGRAEILSAQVNGATLIVLAGFIVYEAIVRLVSPPEVRGGVVLIVAVVGVVVNLLASAVLAGGSAKRSLNVEGALQHVLNDLYAFVATALAGLIVLLTGFDRADPVASLLVATLMLRSGILLLVKSGRVFLEAAPEGVDPDAIGRDLAAQPGVIEVHDLHVWEVTSGFPALSAHVVVRPGDDCHAVRRELAQRVRDRFDIEHTTLQVDHETRGGLIDIETAPAGAAHPSE